MVHGGVGENPHQPGSDQGAGQTEKAHRYLMAFAFGEANQGKAPDPQAQLDKHQPDRHVHQGVAEVAQAFVIHRLTAVGPLRFKPMATHQTIDDHAQNQQHRAHQRLTQGGAGITRGDERGK
ncbi:hypothetical protein D3C77_471080 [compost metagenome]